MKKSLLPFIVCLLWMTTVHAQQDTQDTAIVSAIRQLAGKYLSTPLLSFDLQYRYSSEARPTVWLDSLSGHIKMNGSRYWYLVDSTEMLSGDKFVVILYRQDKIMYLSFPSRRLVPGQPPCHTGQFPAKRKRNAL